MKFIWQSMSGEKKIKFIERYNLDEYIYYPNLYKW